MHYAFHILVSLEIQVMKIIHSCPLIVPFETSLISVSPGNGSRKSETRLEKQLEDRAREIKDLVARLDKALKDKETLK